MNRVLLERNRYFDSVFLMRISHDLERLPGVNRAIVAMGTPANLANLKSAGFAADETAGEILPQDLIIALDGVSSDAIEEASDRLRLLLAGPTIERPGSTGTPRPMSVAEAIGLDPDVNLALISVPGAYAAREARQALRQGLHVMLFSDNVSVEDEVALKDEAIDRGLMMMGPDCGTAILNGTPLGFANVIRRGRIGIVGASGTGIQEVSCLIHRLGEGISQAIGTGGRDLSGTVDARMTRFGIEALADDPETDILVVVSKAPEPAVGERVLTALRAAGKPGVVHFVAAQPKGSEDNIAFAATLADAAGLACATSGLEVSSDDEAHPAHAPVSGCMRALYCGGTLAQEAWAVLRRAGLEVRSNVAADSSFRIAPGTEAAGHVIWDLGDDAFTVGTPHPMIEPSLRDEAVLRVAQDPSVGIVLVDCVLGYGAHPDPAGSLGEAAKRAIEIAAAHDRNLVVVASVTGTDEDPQHFGRQVATLTEAGVLVAPSNAAAVRWVAAALGGGGE